MSTLALINAFSDVLRIANGQKKQRATSRAPLPAICLCPVCGGDMWCPPPDVPDAVCALCKLKAAREARGGA